MNTNIIIICTLIIAASGDHTNAMKPAKHTTHQKKSPKQTGPNPRGLAKLVKAASLRLQGQNLHANKNMIDKYATSLCANLQQTALADITESTNGNTVLHVLLINEIPREEHQSMLYAIAIILAAAGELVNNLILQKNYLGYSPCHYALKNGFSDIYELLTDTLLKNSHR